MDVQRFLSDADLSQFLAELGRKHQVIAPVRTQLGDVLLQATESFDQITTDYEITANSPKEFLFPQVETLFNYRLSESPEIVPVLDRTPRILFGVRPCDVAAVRLMDEVFLGEEADDPYYAARRASTYLLALACPRVFEGHFCVPLGSGPTAESGFDLQFHALDGGFAVEVGSEKGSRLLNSLEIGRAASSKEVEGASEQARLATESFISRFDVGVIQDRLLRSGVGASLFRTLSDRCQTCGGCFYICPTCTCFTLRDQPTGPDTGRRVRSWDTCIFDGFTRLAGGQNPVLTKLQRTEKRYLHKLVQEDGQRSALRCVGCGRCTNACLGNISFSDVLDSIAAGAKR